MVLSLLQVSSIADSGW